MVVEPQTFLITSCFFMCNYVAAVKLAFMGFSCCSAVVQVFPRILFLVVLVFKGIVGFYENYENYGNYGIFLSFLEIKCFPCNYVVR